MSCFIFSYGYLLSGVAMNIRKYCNIFNRLRSLSYLKTLNLSFIVVDVILFESLKNSFNFSCSHINIVGSNSFSVISVFSDDSSSRFLSSDKSLVNKLNFFGLLLFQDDVSVVFSLFLGDNKNFLDVLAFFNFNVLNTVLSEAGLNFVEVIEGFFGLNIFRKRSLLDNSDSGFFRKLNILKLIAEDFPLDLMMTFLSIAEYHPLILNLNLSFL